MADDQHDDPHDPRLPSLIEALEASLREDVDVPLTDADRAMWAWCQGDDRSFDVIVRTFQRPLFCMFRRRTGDEEQSADLVQETFCKILRSRGHFRPGCKARPWIYAIARNLQKDDTKKWWRWSNIFTREAPPSEAASASPTPYEAANAAEIERLLAAMLKELPESQRTAFELVQLDGLSQQEAAAVMGNTVSAVKSLSHRAYCTLREKMTRLNGGPK